MLHGGDEQRIFLFCQSFPGQFSAAQFRQSAQLFPLVPRIILQGTLCEGESRTGMPPQNAFRFYVHQWTDYHFRQLELFLLGQPSLFSQPSTIKPEEIVLWQAETESYTEQSRWKNEVYIVSHSGPFGNDPYFNRMLAARAKRFNLRILPHKPEKNFLGTILADADESPFLETQRQIIQAAQRLRYEFANADIEVYINSPRMNEKMALWNAGVNRVTAK